jgi:HEAT repeat protein
MAVSVSEGVSAEAELIDNEAKGYRVRGNCMLEAALQELETLWANQAAPIVECLAPGSSPGSTRKRAAVAGLVLPNDLVGWFAWHDGLVPGRDREIEMMPAMRPLGLSEALTLRRMVRSALAPVPGLPAPVAGDWLPLLSDDAGEFLFVSVGVVADPAVWAFELSDPLSPKRRFEDLTALARALNTLFRTGLYRFDGGAVRATDPLAAERVIAGFRATGDTVQLAEADTGGSGAATHADPGPDAEAAARLAGEVAGLEGLPRAARLLEAMDRVGTATVIEALRRLDLGAREEAASSLGYTENPAAAPLLLALLGDPEDYVRETAAGAIGMVGDPGVAPRLVPLLVSDNRNLRKAAAFSLGELGVQEAMEGLLGLTRDPVPVVRATAARALGKIGATVDVGPLIGLLEDSYPEASQMAAWALGEIGDPAAIEPLEEAKRSSDRTLSRIAKEALSSLESRSRGSGH